MSSLLQLPEIVLLNIIKKSGLRSICVLRKVCQGLRNLITDAKPDISSLDICVNVYYNVIELCITSWNGDTPESHTIMYQKHLNGCLVALKTLPTFPSVPLTLPHLSFNKPVSYMPHSPPLMVSQDDKTKILEGVDFIQQFSNDFKTILQPKIGKLGVSLFYLHPSMFQAMEPVAVEFLRCLEKVMSALTHKISIDFLYLSVLRIDQFMQILPYTNAKIIEVSSDQPLYMRSRFDAKKLVETDQWRKAERFKCRSFTFTGVDIRSIGHFQAVEVSLDSVKCEDLQVLKEIFMNSSVFEKCYIEYDVFNDVKNMSDVFGPSLADGEWEFQAPDKVLCVKLNSVHHKILFFFQKNCLLSV